MSEPPIYSLNDYTDTNEQLLKDMGFVNEKEIKQALCMSNNDINEAIAILTNEKLPKITALTNNETENDIDMIDANTSSQNNLGDQDPLKFPYDALIQLENNVFTDNWSIPYKKDEWLERLLVSSIALLKENIAELDPNCKKFLDKVFPEVYKKLHDSLPVKNWGNEIQQGVYNMTLLALELIAIRTSQEGVPEVLLNTLTLLFNPDTNFHVKNSHKNWSKYYNEVADNLNEPFTKNLDTHCWLLDFINYFGMLKGFDAIKNQLEKSNDINEINTLLKPLAICSFVLNDTIFRGNFESSIKKIFQHIKSLTDDDYKDKNAGRVFELIHTIKKLCASIWPEAVDQFNLLHLNTVLCMLKYSHFNSKMNSLKEICKLIENATALMNLSKVMIKEDKLSEWIITEKVLSFAVEGNIDQSQYCEKIKTIVEFIGDRIKCEEISALWEMQYNKSMSIIDNLYTIIGIAATKFNSEQLDYLLAQIIQTWNKSSFKLHDKLVGLLRIIGREAKSNKTTTKILEALWELRNRPGLNRQLLLLIYTEHLNVLTGGRFPREAAKREYLKKCCEDIKKSAGTSIAIASLRHMYEILNSYQKNSSKALKEVLTELVVPIMKNLCTSLLKCHSNAYEKAKLSNQKFDQTALIDGLFTHEEAVQSHLNSMKFILQEGHLYLNLNRAQDIWNTLITNEHSCDWDKRIGFEWFIDCWTDLIDESRSEIFKKQILTLKPCDLLLKGYECFKLYFIRVNENESKIQVKNEIENFTVDKLDLTGLNFVWDVILYVDDENIADLATKFLLEISFEKVSLRIKRELVSLHQRFIKECYSRLENCLITLESSPVGQLLLNAFKISCLSISLTEYAQMSAAPRTQTMKCIERLLMIAERYIVKVEENQTIQRTYLPHFLTFKSESFSLSILCETPRQSIDLFVCSNETLGELRTKIANALGILSNNLQIYNNDKLLNLFHDQKLLTQLGIDGMKPLNVKTASTYPSSLNQTPVKDSNISFPSRSDPELEKSFPGVLIANNNAGSAFEMLHRLEELADPKINNRVRNILKLIPTNPRLLESYDRIIGKLADSSSTSSSSQMIHHPSSSTASATSTAGMVKSPSVSTLTSQSISNTASVLNQFSQSQQKNLSSQSTPTTPTFSNNIISNNAAASSQASSFSYVTNSVNAVTSLFMKRNDSSTSLDSSRTSNYLLNDSKDYLKFFDKSLPLHRCLYNLEALSSKIMPSSNEANVQQNADLFLQDFLKANGLETLISLLKLESFSGSSNNNSYQITAKTNEYETKQDIYILLLQLLRLIFFGSYHPVNAIAHTNSEYNSVNKRPSSEPITTCAKKTILPSMIDNQSGQTNSTNQTCLSLKNANNCPDSNLSANLNENKMLNLIEKMSLNEVTDILVQLLIICWASAAGNLQLAHSNLPTGINALTENKSPRTISNSSTSSINGLTSNNMPNACSTQKQNINSVKSSSLLTEQANEETKETKASILAHISSEPDKPETESVNENSLETNNTLKPGSSIQKEVKFFIQDHRLSTGSNMSTSSIDSTENNSQQQNFSPSLSSGLLQAGICIKQTSISNKDIKIALKAIELISCFLNNRKDCVSSFLGLKMFSECVIDVLTGSTSSKIRAYMRNFLLKLCQIDVNSFKCKDYLISLIIKSRLPLWVNSSISRTSTQRLILQSTEYFSLRSKLFEHMTLEEQATYSIDLKKMLSDQLNWFLIFSPTRNLKHVDSILLAGHLSLTKALLTCETANKVDFGNKIIPLLIKTYLFPAAFLISNPSEDTSMDPMCGDESTRLEAYKLLVELSRNCHSNFQMISKQLIKFHHSQTLMSNDWNYIPLVTPRAECGFVGLKNGGATCYMNAILQQLFMMPGVPEYLLSIDSDDLEKSSVFYQLQNVFAHLKESKLEYYVPETFWKAFRMWGQEVNIREQQDAYDFFISMTDQIDEYLKKMNKEPVFKNILEGAFSNQFICTDCPHQYEREEAFLGLNLPIKSGNLEESLLQFVKDELLDGENSYNCEKCNEKRSAIKRTCIKKLPKYLCIQLKRFDYDWESNRSLKFDDYFQFPRVLDVSPYMYESINKSRHTNNQNYSTNLDKQNSTSLTNLDDSLNAESKMDTNNISSLLSQSLPNQAIQFKKRISLKNEPNEILYELAGIVVHSGQANAGHYYSFIKGLNSSNFSLQQELEELEERDRLLEEDENSSSFSEEYVTSTMNRKEKLNKYDEKKDKWYKFNDTGVEEIQLNENTLIEECFGGTFTQSSEFKMLPEERVRYWNGYMLFYREINYNGVSQQNVLRTANNKLKHQRKEQFSSSKSKVSSDSLSELAELVSKGDEKGLFRTCLPSSIEQIVKSENLEFCKNRTIYGNDYFQFIYELVKLSKDITEEGSNKSVVQGYFIANSCNLGLEFLYNTFFKTGKKLRVDMNRWLDLFKELMSYSKEAASTMLDFIVDHETNSNFIRHYLLECPINEIRDACAQLFDFFFNNLIVKFKFNPLANSKITSLITSFVQLLDKAVIDLCKNSHEYFKVLFNYADLSKETTKQLISLGLFSKLLCFLLGNPGTVKQEESSNRRWNTIQSREFAIVHELIAILVLKCNIYSLKTCEQTEKPESMAEVTDKLDSKDSEFSDQIIIKNADNESFKINSLFQPPSNTEDLIQLPQEMQIYLIGALSNRYLKELVFAFEQINPNLLSKTLEMILSCCYCNELFSGSIIHQILIHVNNSSFNEIKQVLCLLNYIVLIEDPLQHRRLQLAIDGYKDNDVIYNGLLSIVRQNQGSDAKKSYQCVKFIVTLANTSNSCKEYLLKTAPNWEWSVNWLKKKMLDSNFTNWTMTKSNEDSESRTFQRTKSAQRTLDDATALLKSGSEND